ncbi:hypothetical protein MVEN_02249600 [Mycena venus]|uniref:Uncharacterized protein n=1 Tax=Mycena venus TaxID=2733690 RepID=A0A8H6X696_9AGAR|nr:hypothetical protein MVEN_02249600 [Mycena venus]
MSSPFGFPGPSQTSGFGQAQTVLGAPPPFASPGERHTRAVEWGALLERRRRAGERAMADAREAEERRIARERWEREYGVPMGRGAPVAVVYYAGGNAKEKRRSASLEKGKEKEKEKSMGMGKGGDGDVEMPEQANTDAEADVDAEAEEEVDIPGGYSPEDAYAEDDYGRLRRRSPLCIVSVAPAVSPPSPLVLDAPASPQSQSPAPQSPSQAQGVDGAQGQGQEQQQQNGNGQENAGGVGGEEGQASQTNLMYDVAPQLPPYPPQPSPDDDLGPDPATRMNTGWGPWKIACRMRVWDVRQRYTPGLIRSLVAQEADDYFSARGLPHPDALLFMDEEYYDWELEESASEGDGSGCEDDGEGESSFELEHAAQQSFALDPSSDPDCRGDSPSGDHEDGGGNGSNAEMDMGSGMGGVLSSFYVAPTPAQTAMQAQIHVNGGGVHNGFPPQMQLPLPLPPPPLASVRVPVLRHLFTDIPIAPAAGTARGRGTPIDLSRKAAWGGGNAEDVEVVGAGRGTLERRLPHPRPRPHPMYLAMARAVEDEAYGDPRGGGSSVEEPPMLPMRGLRELVRSLRGDSEDEGMPEESREHERQEMSEAFEPDEAVWQEFLKSVGVENGTASTSATSGQINGDAMDIDPAQNAMDADADADADADYDNEESGGSGGHDSSSTSSMLSTGVEMGVGMFGMAMGAMGLGWFGGPTSPPVPVAVGDVGDRERDRESSLSFALGV